MQHAARTRYVDIKRIRSTIESGMVMMIETCCNDFPSASVHVKNLILVTDDGARDLTNASRHDKIWELGV